MLPQMEFDFRIYTNAPVQKPKEVAQQPVAEDTIANVMAAYKVMLGNTCKPHTATSYANDILIFHRFLKICGIADKSLREITQQDLNNFIAHLNNNKEARKSVYRRGTSLKHFFGWLVK